MRLRLIAGLVGFVFLSACGGSTEPIRSNGGAGETVPGAWTATLNEYTQIRVRMTERPEDHALFGNWAGDRANCSGACRDTGVVFSGQRTGVGMAFSVTASNGTRSLAISGVMAADSSITGTAAFTDNGTHAPTEPVVLKRR